MRVRGIRRVGIHLTSIMMFCGMAGWLSWFQKSAPAIDVLNLTLGELSVLLHDGKVNSVGLVRAYLAQIKKHDKHGAHLNAIINAVSEDELLKIAEHLDSKRSEIDAGLKPLYGIPFLVKDNIWTAEMFGVPTTSGAVAFEKAMAKENAPIVQKLIDAGMIMLAKTNLNELAAMKTMSLTGWSALGGQTQSAYVVGGVIKGEPFLGHSTPGGSSAGSAVGVAAGMAPVALGTETDGSIVVPSDRASLYSVKITVGGVSVKGTFPYTPFTDTAGPMGKSALDMALMLDVILPGRNFRGIIGEKVTFEGLKIGFLDPVKWAPGTGAVPRTPEYDEQVLAEFNMAVDKIEKAKAVVTRDLPLRRFGSEDDKMFTEMAWHDAGPAFQDFASGLTNSPVSTLQGLAEWNRQNAKKAMPEWGQEILEDVVSNSDKVSDSDYEKNRIKLRENNRDNGLDAVFKKYDLDVIMGTPTGRSATVAAVAGYPLGTVPLGYAKLNGRPFGLAIIAPPNREDLIIKVMAAWEATFGPRKPPPQLVNWDKTWYNSLRL